MIRDSFDCFITQVRKNNKDRKWLTTFLFLLCGNIVGIFVYILWSDVFRWLILCWGLYDFFVILTIYPHFDLYHISQSNTIVSNVFIRLKHWVEFDKCADCPKRVSWYRKAVYRVIIFLWYCLVIIFLFPLILFFVMYISGTVERDA